MPCRGDGVFEDPVTGHCYWYVSETNKDNWLNSQAKCKSWGDSSADLAAISSELEYSFIVSQLGSSLEAWIGGRNLDNDAVDDYVWSNGEQWGYAPSGLPANDPDRPCIRLKLTSFQAKACSELNECLCERD